MHSFCMNIRVFCISQTVVLNEYLLGIATFASVNSLIIPPPPPPPHAIFCLEEVLQGSVSEVS